MRDIGAVREQPPSSPTCLTGMIVECPSPRLRALLGAPRTPGIPLVNRTLVAYQVAFLRQRGVTRVLQASGRAAPVPLADDDGADRRTEGPVLVLEGDVLTDADVSAMVRFHAEHSAAATVMLARNGRSRADGRAVDGGLYIVDAALLPSLLARWLESGRTSFLGALLATTARWVAWSSPAYCRRIHTPAAYHAAHMDLLCGRVGTAMDPAGASVNGCWIGDRVDIGPGAMIRHPSVVGTGVKLGAGARVGPYAVIGADSRLAPHTHARESVVGDGVIVGASAILDGCVVGSGARVAPFSILARGAVLAGGAVQRSRTLLPR
jgi:NDP-sugar pyrophosphorylase family protein